MKFWGSVSFESDTHPVETIRIGEVEAADAEEAMRRCVRRAWDSRTGKGKFRSLAAIVEAIPTKVEPKPTNKHGVNFAASENKSLCEG